MKTNVFLKTVIMTVAFFFASSLFAQEEAASKTWTSDEAWSFLKNYQYGDDWKPLLLIENEVEEANQAAETEKTMAEKLAGFLGDDCSLACRQFVCMQLRLVGGADQVPALATLLNRPDECENARLALEVIPGDESLTALREALSLSTGTARVGMINSLAKRSDEKALSSIIELTSSDDASVKSAAVYALGKYGQAGLDALAAANFPVTDQIAGQAALNIAEELAAAGNIDAARSIYDKYAVDSAQRGCRKAALVGLLKSAGENKNALVVEWFTGNDATKVILAAAHLNELSADEFAKITADQEKLSDTAKIAFLEMSVEKEGVKALDRLIAELKSSDPITRATAARLIARLGDADAVPALIELLGSNDPAVITAARESIQQFPADTVGPQLIAAMKENASAAVEAINLLAVMKYYNAIDPMIQMAKSTDTKLREKVIEGLSKLADPDEIDLPRLLNLYKFSAQEGYRDKVERAIVIVCKKGENAAEKVVAAIDKADGKISDESNILLLPLLGKLGGEYAHNQIRAALKDKNPQVAAAAMRGFCNWPDATYADELWTLATDGNDAIARQMALRAYIRVVSLKNDRPAADTLQMLKNAFNEAKATEDKQLVITRAAEIRDMATVTWLADFLDNAALNQAACASLAKMAHHRELREPNKAAFAPILEKVEKTANDNEVIEAAKKARMGM